MAPSSPSSNPFAALYAGRTSASTEAMDVRNPNAGSDNAAAGSAAGPSGAVAGSAASRPVNFMDDIEISDYESPGDADIPDAPNAQVLSEGQSLQVLSHRKVVTQLPKDMHFMEFAQDPPDLSPYPPMIGDIPLDVVHREYRQTDRMNNGNFRVGPQLAQILFFDKDKCEGKGRLGSIGHLTQWSSQSEKLVKVSYTTDTQMPALNIVLKRDVSSTESFATFKIFSNSLQVSDGGIPSVQMQMFTGESSQKADEEKYMKYFENAYPNLAGLAKDKNLMLTTVALVEPGTYGPTEYKRRPVWVGLSDVERKGILKKAEAWKAFNAGSLKTMPARLTPFEDAVAKLESTVKFGVFRCLSSADKALVAKFKNYWLGCIYLSIKFKNFWFYQMQHQPVEGDDGFDTDIHRPEFDIFKLQAPRWMTDQWLTPAVEKGKRTFSYDAYNWASFADFSIFPSALDCAFLVRLSLARERNAQQLALSRMINSDKSPLTASFFPVKYHPGHFVARITASEIKIGSTWELAKPDVDTRVVLHVDLIGGQSLRYKGSVVESTGDANGGDDKDNWDFTLALSGNEYDFGVDKYTIRLEIIDDDTTITRAKCSTEGMSMRPSNRDHGVDLPAVIFNAPYTIEPEKQDSLGKSVDPKTLEQVLDRFRKHYKLNEEQVLAATDAISTPLTLVYGPPGTGKSTTVTASAAEHALLKHKVIFTCPSNNAADAALTSFLKKANKEIRAVRFVGGSRSQSDLARASNKKPMSEPTEDQLWSDLFMSSVEAAEKENPDQVYSTAKRREIIKWAKKHYNHAMQIPAEDYLRCEQDLAKGKTGNTSRRSLLEKMRILDEDLSSYFFENCVDIVFTTCSSAGHPTLGDSFKPQVAYIDEAGQATIPDACIALDSYKNTIQALILSGDPNQLIYVVTAKTANEGLHLLEKSIFARLIHDPNERFPHRMLRVQYRSHPDIMHWPASQFYIDKKGEMLQNAAIASEGNSLQRTVKSFFNLLGYARKNDRNRIGIDCSSDKCVSEPYENTQSLCNVGEAEMIVGLITLLLSYNPPEVDDRGRKMVKVKPENIGVITPYKGQRRLIRKLLQEKGSDLPAAQVIFKGTLSTTWGIQGSEVDIAFVSMVAHDRKEPASKLKFIGQENVLCVQNTRARFFQITTGNFRGWCQAMNSSAEGKGIMRNMFAAFRGFVSHHYSQGDIVSHKDVVDRFEKDIVPKSSVFYDELVPELKTRNKHHIAKKLNFQGSRAYKVAKRESQAPGQVKGKCKGRGAGTGTGTGKGPAQEQPVSKREQKRRAFIEHAQAKESERLRKLAESDLSSAMDTEPNEPVQSPKTLLK